MNFELDLTPPRPARQVYAVGELAEKLRGLLEASLPSVWVQGEVSNFRNPSGHWYFTLKDSRAQVRCAMFKGRNLYVRPVPKDGDQVLLRGQVSFYEQRGDLQIIAEHMEPAGEGALLRAFEELKKKLAAEGLFDEALKRPLPEVPRHIGVITSPTGAALQDILTTLRRRYPMGTVHLYPVPVQGAVAAGAIVQALGKLPGLAPVDVIILARGGGSLEDLWSFNDERVARAIRACPVPVVVGVGHEIDFTIADFAADLRAPTPTAAAELVAPDVAEWREHLAGMRELLARRQIDRIEQARLAVGRLQARLDVAHPGRRLERHAQRLDELGERLFHCGPAAIARRQQQLAGLRQHLLAVHPAQLIQLQRQSVERHTERMRERLAARLRELRARLDNRAALLESLGPRAVLERGYAIAQRGDGTVLRDAAGVAVDETVNVTLASGRLVTRVTDTRS